MVFSKASRCVRQDVVPGPRDLWEANKHFEGAPPEEILRRDEGTVLAIGTGSLLEGTHGFGTSRIAPFAHVEEDRVHGYIAGHDAPVNPLLKKGYGSTGCETQTRSVSPDEDRRGARWSGTGKIGCGLHRVEGPRGSSGRC